MSQPHAFGLSIDGYGSGFASLSSFCTENKPSLFEGNENHHLPQSKQLMQPSFLMQDMFQESPGGTACQQGTFNREAAASTIGWQNSLESPSIYG